MKARFLGRPAHRLLTVPTKLSGSRYINLTTLLSNSHCTASNGTALNELTAKGVEETGHSLLSWYPPEGTEENRESPVTLSGFRANILTRALLNMKECMHIRVVYSRVQGMFRPMLCIGGTVVSIYTKISVTMISGTVVSRNSLFAISDFRRDVDEISALL
jgi:hypothetical protein